jgi:hypothetical protein
MTNQQLNFPWLFENRIGNLRKGVITLGNDSHFSSWPGFVPAIHVFLLRPTTMPPSRYT